MDYIIRYIIGESVTVDGREFRLIGTKGITCNGDVFDGCEFSQWSSRLGALGVEIFNIRKGIWNGPTGYTLVDICMFGENSTGYKGSSGVKKPELKQTDRVTPRVCKRCEHGIVRDAFTKEIISL